MTRAVLALGLVLTTATQLRPGELPIGPAELLLLAWLSLAALHLVLSDPVPLNAPFRRLSLFWLLVVLGLMVGMVAGIAIEPFHDYVGMARDAVAYGLMLALGLMMALRLADAGERRKVVWLMVVIGTVSLTLQIGGGFGVFPNAGMHPWHWDRLRGWSENPNQFGFFALVVTLLALHLADSARSTGERALAIACAAPAVLAGALSHSDSFVIGLMLSGAVFLTLKSVSWVRDAEVAPSLKGAAVVLGIMALPLAIAASAPVMSSAMRTLEQSSENVYDENDQGETRLHLWTESLEKAVDSKLLGFGPGPHLTSKSFKRPPPSKFEAHNTLCDLLTQGGLLAVAAFIWISASTLAGAARAGRPALAGLVTGLLVFSMFHYTLRHPIFWFVIVLCLLEAADARAGRRALGATGPRWAAPRPVPGRAGEPVPFRRSASIHARRGFGSSFGGRSVTPEGTSSSPIDV